MQRGLILLLTAVLLLFPVVFSADDGPAFYMIGREGNNLVYYGSECNIVFSPANGTATVYHRMFSVETTASNPRNILCSPDRVEGVTAPKITDAKCLPLIDKDAVSCGNGCRIVETSVEGEGNATVSVRLWGFPQQFCVDGACTVMVGQTNEFNTVLPEGNHEIGFLCDGNYISTYVSVPPATTKEANAPELNVPELSVPETNVPAEVNAATEANIPEANVPAELNAPVKEIRARAARMFLRPDEKVEVNGDWIVTEKPVEMNVEPIGFVKPYALVGRKVIPLIGRVVLPAGRIKILSSAPPIRREGEKYVIQSKKEVSVDVNADRFYVSPTNIPGAPGTILAVFSFEKNVPAGGSVTVRISVPGENVRLWKFDGTNWTEIEYVYSNGWAEYNVTDNGPLDQDPTPGHIVDDVAVGTGGLTITANLNPQITGPGEAITVYGNVEKNGSAVANNWVNIYLDGNRLGGPQAMSGKSNWFDPNWKYRREINISNPTGTDLTDYVVKVTLDLNSLYHEGKLRRDAGDLRFVDSNGNILNYWIESQPATETALPRSSDDTDTTTQDTDCGANQVFKYYYTVDPDGSSGNAEEPANWYATDFNDESWTDGAAPFGNTGGECTNVLTTDPSDLFVRKWFRIDGEPIGADINIAVGGGIRCYVNGNLVLDELNAANTASYWNYSIHVDANVLKEGDNLLACWIAVGGENAGGVSGYFDVDIEANYYERLLTNANVWVKVSSIPAGGTKIYAYYGNPDATPFEDYDAVFDTFNVGLYCQGSTNGGACSVNFDPTTIINDGSNYIFAEIQRYGYGTMDMYMSGDFASANEYASVYYQPDSAGWTYLGDYTSSTDGCTDERAQGVNGTEPPWPIDVTSWIAGQPNIGMQGDTTAQVNFDPGCGYYYHFVWYINAKVRRYVNPEPTTSVGPEMQNTSTDSKGDFSWTFNTPTSVGEHNVQIDVNDGVDFVSITLPLYVVGNLSIEWADTLPRVKNGYQIYVRSLDTGINEVNVTVSDLNGTYNKNLSCTTSNSVTWLCDLNTYEINAGTYIVKAYGYTSGALTGFDAKYSEGGPLKSFEFSDERDANTWSNVLLLGDKVTLQGILSGFTYRRPITIDNSAGPEYNALAVKVIVDTQSLISAGKMKNDCSDVRFTDEDGATELNYWLERGCGTTSTVFWVKVPNIPARGSKTIYMYYDNPRATDGSNGKGVFDFFDDFESWTGWTQYGSGIVSQDCSNAWDGSCSLLKTANNDPNGGYKDLGFTLNYPFVLEAEILRINTNGGSQDRIGVTDDSGNGYGFAYIHGTTQVGVDVRTNMSASQTRASASYNPQGEWYHAELEWDGNGTIIARAYTSDGTLIGSVSITDSSYSSFTRVYVAGGYTYAVDDIRIRPLVQNPPVAVMGSEEAVPNVATSGSGTWLNGYSGRDVIELDNSSGGDLTDYQVKIVTNTAALISEGKLKNDCSDIRFADSDGTTLLPYWIEPGTCNTASTVIWVKVPSIPAGAVKTIYMYYNNPSATSAADPTQVFDFFDDFETWAGWTQYGSGVVAQDCSNAWDGSCSLHKTTNNDPNGGYKDLGFTLNYPFVLEAEVYRPSGYAGGSYDRIGMIDANGNGYGAFMSHGAGTVGVDVRNNYSATVNSSSALANPLDRWYRMSLTWNAGTITASISEENGDAIGSYTINDSSYSSFTRVYVFGGYDYYVDDIRIRKYTPTPPTVRIRTYEPIYAPSGYVKFKTVSPIAVEQWTYLDVNVDNVRSTEVNAEIYDTNGTLLCSVEITPGVTRYDISGCVKDVNEVVVKLVLSTNDLSVTPVVRSAVVHWVEQTNIKLTEPNSSYVFRNELMHVAGWLKNNQSGCTEVNAYLYFRTSGSPNAIEEYNYDQFITRSYDENVQIGDDVRPKYLHPNLGYYVREITIDNPAGVDLTNYPVKIVINTQNIIGAGQMRDDCGDIRVTDASYNELNYWIRDGTCNTATTEIWVRVPSIPASGTKIYLFHGRLDYTSKSNGDAVFPDENTLSGECQGRSPGGTCSVTLSLPSGYVFAPYQPTDLGYGELNMVMSGDFGPQSPIANTTSCTVSNGEMAAFILDNSWCLGIYASGYQDCTDRTPPTWPKDLSDYIPDRNQISILADAASGVNYDPGCGYYYHYIYTLKAKVRPYVNPEPTVSVPASSRPDVPATSVYVSDPLDTGQTTPNWGPITWGGNTPDNTDIKVYVRTSPDKTTWSQWYEVQNGDTIPAPAQRYIEYNVVFYVLSGATDFPVFDDLKIIHYTGVPNWTLVTPTNQVLSSSDPNPYQCGALSVGGECTPDWNAVPKDKGKYELMMTVTSDCSFEGNSNVKYVYSFAKTAITNLSTDKNVVAKGDSYTVTGSIVDELGDPVRNAKIYFYEYGTYIGETTSKDDGSFSFTYTVPITASIGVHTIEARFDRDGINYYWESSASTTVKYTSKPKIQNLVVNPTKAGIGDSVSISATVTDEVGISSVGIDVTDPDGVKYSDSMNCSGSSCSYEFNDTWSAGTYSFTITATNLDGISTEANGTFLVEGHAVYAAQVEKNTYGSLEDVLQWNGEYWANPLGTYSFTYDASSVSGRDVALTLSVPYENDPFDNTTAYEFLRYDGAEFNTSYGQGHEGNALILAGNGGVVFPLSRHILAPRITITAWIRVDSSAGDRYVIHIPESGGGLSYALYSPNGDTNACLAVNMGGTTYSACSSSLSTGTWHFVAASFDGQIIRVYVDGTLSGYYDIGTTGDIDYTTALDFGTIGARYNGTSFDGFWNGGIDELKIFPKALTDTEITKIYNGELVRENPNAYWTFEGSAEDSHPYKESPILVTDTGSDKNVTVYVRRIGAKESAAVSGATSVAGKEGNAAYFNGSATITYPGSALDMNMFSVALWIKPEANAGILVNKGYNNNPSWKVELLSDGRVACTIRTTGGTDYTVTAGPVDTNVWSHVACVFDRTYLREYINGAEANSVRVDYFGGLANSFDLVVGSGYTGAIDDLRVYDWPISAKDVQNLYNGKDVPYALALYQSFDTNNWDDESEDWTVTLFSGGWPALSWDTIPGTGASISTAPIYVWKRAAICNTGETNVSGYLYVDVQTGAGSTWSTVPPVTLNDAATGTKRTILPGTCLDVAGIYNKSPWNTSNNPAGTYRLRMILLKRNGSPGNTSDYVKTTDGWSITDTSEFNIVTATLTLSDINHTNLALHNLNEYETTDDINWIDVYVTAKDSTAVNTRVALTLTDEYKAYAGFGPNKETKNYGTIQKDTTVSARWDNGGSGYHIPENASAGTYAFRWLVEMNADNAPYAEDFTRFVTIHNLPSDFNSSAPTRIYYYDTAPGWGIYEFCMKNPWSRELNNISVKINCPSGVGLSCVGTTSGTDTETLTTLSSGSSACFDFNVIASSTAISGDYDVNVDVSYTNPAGNVKNWYGMENRIIEIRKAGILEIILDSYDTNAIRGETNVSFVSKAHNTGTVNDENAWIAYTHPSDWTVASKSTDGSWGTGDVNAFKSVVPPDANIELNVTFSVPADANLGPQLVRIDTYTATNPSWSDFKNVYVTVWDRPDMNLTADDYNASVGEKITLFAHLTYSNGNSLANQRVNFEKNGSPLGAADTNADGWATYVWDLTYESPGTYVVKAVYDGNNDIYTLSAEANITVNIGRKPEVNASAYPSPVGYGMDVTIEANVSDDQGVKSVWATVKRPDTNEFNVSLSNVGGNTYQGTFQPWQEGDYAITVYAQDLYDSITAKGPITVTAEANAAMGVETDKNFYLQGEAVKLRAPDWWNIGWKYRVPITVKNGSATEAMNNNPVLIKVDTESLISAGKMRSDAGDIRFVTVGGTELNYWFQEVNKIEIIIPRASDDLDPNTADTDCTTNPTYKYYACSDPCNPTGWYETSYDDSAWLEGYAPFGGTGGQCTDALTSAPDDLFVRKWFVIPGKPVDVNIYISSDDGARCYVNGNLVLDDLSSSHTATYWNYGPIDVTSYVHEGNNLIACWVANGGENGGTGTGYFDAMVVAKYTDYAMPDANVWVVVPYVPADGNTTIYMYYGNPNATSERNVDRVFPKTNLTVSCQGSTTGGSCSATFLSENNVWFAPYQDGATIDMNMSGDFGNTGEYADVYYQPDAGTQTYIGAYTSGADGCTDVRAQPYNAGDPTWPMDATSWIVNQPDLTMTGTTTSAVNFDPGCGYYYHFVWTLTGARIRNYNGSDPTVSIGAEETLNGSYVLPELRTFRGYILGVVERNTDSGWAYVDTDVNDLATGTLRTFTLNNLFDLSTVWNDWNTYGQPQGTYRARITIVGPDGNALTYNGQPIEEYNVFQIGPPPVDVSITDFRVYDVNGVADPRTEGNLVDSGLEKTIYVSADREYRIEFDVTVGATSNDWNVADSNVWFGELNASWNVLDFWYTLPDGTDKNGGNFDGNVHWDTNNDGTAGQSQTVTFHFIVDLNTLTAEEWNAVAHVTHPAFVERTDWVNIKTYVPDVFPPNAMEYNLVNLETNQTGWEINAIRSLENVKIYAYWDEDIGEAYVEYNGTSSTLTTANITPDGNYTEYNFTITSFWLLGPHVAKIHAADLSGNWNHDLNFLTFYVWGLARVSSMDLNDNNVYINDPVEINCTVVDATDSDAPIANYPVKFWDNGTLIGTAYTNANGIASIVWVPNSYGTHILECNVETNSELWYTIDPPNNEKNTTLFIKESVPPSWNDANGPAKIHRGEVFETNVHWWDNDKIDTVSLFVKQNGGAFAEVNSVKVDANDVYVVVDWAVPADANLGPAQWYQEANDPSGNVTDTNAFDFNVWGWAYVSDSFINPTGVAPGGEVNAYCQVKDYTVGNALANYTVYFEIEGNYMGSADTNADGWAMYTFNAPSTTGLYNVTCWIEANAERFYDPYPDKNSATNILNVTLSADTDPPDAVTWELNDLNRAQVNVSGDTTGQDINVIRGDDINFWAYWNEDLNNAWIETNVDATTTRTFSATVDGNYSEGIIETNADWTRGQHYAKMTAQDLVGNPSTDANSANAYYTVWVYSDVKWVAPTGTVSKNEYNLTCFVYEDDTNTGVANYSVAFYDNVNGYLGSATTDGSGYARLLVDFNTYAYGSYYFWCQISDWPAEYYKAKTDQDGATINVASVNLKAVSAELNTDSNSVKEGDIVRFDGNIWNQYDAVDANVDVLVQKWTGSDWNTIDQNRYTHSFASDENATFTYIWTAYPGRYRFVIVADPDSAIDEENEADNNAWIELNVSTWGRLYGEVNGLEVLGSNTYYFYTWSGTGNGVELFYDADVNDLNVDALNAMTTITELNLADYTLGTNGNPDCILCRYDSNGDGIIDQWHVFDIGGRNVNAPVFYVENWPVGILYEGSGGFTGSEPIVFVTEIYDNQACSESNTGVCDYVADVPSPLKKQFGTTDKIKIQVVR